MENREHSLCTGFVDYMTGEMSDVDRKRFERHLETCAICREDAVEWRLTWDRLGDDTPQLDVPPDLKEEVMGAIFAGVGESGQRASGIPAHRRFRTPLRRAALAAVLALAFIAGFGSREWLHSFGQPVLQAEEAPSRIEKLIRLDKAGDNAAYPAGKAAYGIACLLKTDGESRLVVYTFGSPQTMGESVYQVWLMKDGIRSSAGTFTVDASGIGVLTVPWSENSPAFDTVGVTLEPDLHSTTPRGLKMFKSA